MFLFTDIGDCLLVNLYSVRYIQLDTFDRHDCDSNWKTDQVLENLQVDNSEFDNNTKESEISHWDEPAEDHETVDYIPLLNINFSNHKTESFVDESDEGQRSNDEILDDDIFEELLQEAFFTQ